MQTVYLTHSKAIDYQNELYKPIRDSALNLAFNLILPHEFSQEPYNSRDLILKSECDIVLAEVSAAATGRGIELGWANAMKLPIIAFNKQEQNYLAQSK